MTQNTDKETAARIEVGDGVKTAQEGRGERVIFDATHCGVRIVELCERPRASDFTAIPMDDVLAVAKCVNDAADAMEDVSLLTSICGFMMAAAESAMDVEVVTDQEFQESSFVELARGCFRYVRMTQEPM